MLIVQNKRIVMSIIKSIAVALLFLFALSSMSCTSKKEMESGVNSPSEWCSGEISGFIGLNENMLLIKAMSKSVAKESL
jgi:hypothetical protein